MGVDEDGTKVHAVTAFNQARVQRELDLGRATLTAPLVGLTCQMASGVPGEVEQQVLDLEEVHPADFRVRELPEIASDGRGGGILQPVRDLPSPGPDRRPRVRLRARQGKLRDGSCCASS